jgi:cardiolipin synthase
MSRFIPGNQVTLLQNGETYLPAIEAAFDRAKHDIYLQTYIYEQDATGQRIADALKRAVLCGVNAYVLIDGYGSKDLPRDMLDRMRADGLKVLIFRPKQPGRERSSAGGIVHVPSRISCNKLMRDAMR